MRASIIRIWLLPALVAFGGVWTFPGFALGDEQRSRSIEWGDLKPSNPVDSSSEERDNSLSEMLADELVRIEGYVVPIDRHEDIVYEFFLIPWPGSCSHAPQPPPNQVLHVKPATPFKMAKTYEFVSVTGYLNPGIENIQFFMMDGWAEFTSGYSIAQGETQFVRSEYPQSVAVSPLGISAN